MPDQQHLYAIKRPDGSLEKGSLLVLFTRASDARNQVRRNHGCLTHLEWRKFKAAGWRIVEVEVREVEDGE